MSKRLDVEKAITYITPKSRVGKSSKTQTIRYNANGESDQNLDKKFTEEETCAIAMLNKKGDLFKVKVDKSNKLYNPLKQSFEYTLEMRDRNTKEYIFSLRDTGKYNFEKYVQFLKTRHTSFLYQAERN